MTEPRSISIELAGMPPEVLRKNGRPGNRQQLARVKAEEKERAFEHVLAAMLTSGYEITLGVPLFEYAELVIDTYWFSKPIDFDGMACGAGAWLDAFHEHELYKVIEDDNPFYLVNYRIPYHRVKDRADRRCVITMTETTDG